MNNLELSKLLNESFQNNPFIEYTPSNDLSNYLEETIAYKKNLKDELYLQLHTQSLPYNTKITNYIIESLDNHGFFNIDLNIAIKDTNSSLDEFINNLKLIQSFEPIGVAAKNSIDSIKIQLNYQGLKLASKILDYENAIINKDYKYIAKKLNVEVNDIIEALKQIQTCTPYPCSDYDTSKSTVIIPEFEIIVENNTISIEPKDIGQIKLNSNGNNIIDPELKKYLNEAKFFIDSINKRNKTLLVVANELIEIHKTHFLYNDELKACKMNDIAQKTGFSISTISRTINDKYYLFNDQLYLLKDLFISSTKYGSSKDAIIKAIKYYINLEDKNKPYDDNELVSLLNNLELFVSRRTISKYRQEMNIPNSKQRKKDPKVY